RPRHQPRPVAAGRRRLPAGYRRAAGHPPGPGRAAEDPVPGPADRDQGGRAQPDGYALSGAADVRGRQCRRRQPLPPRPDVHAGRQRHVL
ncbi:hypothetical protein LTR94_034583, partial [Friedmanniomyces endolithicus]